MGQHKHNPNCELAKKGLLPDKKKRLSKRERERLLMDKIQEVTGINKIRDYIGGGYNAFD